MMTADHPRPAGALNLEEIGRHLDKLSQPPASGPNAFWQLRHDRDHAIGTARTLLAELARRDAALEQQLTMLNHFTGQIGDDLRDAMVADMLGSFRKGWAAAAAALRTMADDYHPAGETAVLIHQLANALEAALVPDTAQAAPLHVEDGNGEER